MKKYNYLSLASMVLIFVLLFNCQICEAESLSVTSLTFSDPHNPSISRFIGFGGIIPSNVVEKIYSTSVKIYINGKDLTPYLVSAVNVKTSEICFIYEPVKPLPAGEVNVKITALSKDGMTLGYNFSFMVNPAADKSLAPYAYAARNPSAGFAAHLNLAKAYERKCLFSDAYEEYKQAYSLNPKNTQASSGFLRTFMMLEKKYIESKKENVTIIATKNAGLDILGNLMLFDVKIINDRVETIKFNPNECLLTTDSNEKIRPEKTFNDFYKKAFEDELIPQENYAQLRYVLGVNPYKLFELKKDKKDIEIQPGKNLIGYLAFALKVPRYKNITLRVPVFYKLNASESPKRKTYFNLPFRSVTIENVQTSGKSFIPKLVKDDTFTLTVTDWETSFKIKDYYSPSAPGFKFAVVYLSLKNNSDNIKEANLKNFTLTDKNGRSFKSSSLSYFPLLLLKKSDVKFGYLVFQIPKESTPFKITMQRADSQPISVDLL